jgi:hypothetical protein
MIAFDFGQPGTVESAHRQISLKTEEIMSEPLALEMFSDFV